MPLLLAAAAAATAAVVLVDHWKTQPARGGQKLKDDLLINWRDSRKASPDLEWFGALAGGDGSR